MTLGRPGIKASVCACCLDSPCVAAFDMLLSEWDDWESTCGQDSG